MGLGFRARVRAAQQRRVCRAEEGGAVALELRGDGGARLGAAQLAQPHEEGLGQLGVDLGVGLARLRLALRVLAQRGDEVLQAEPAQLGLQR